MAELLVHGPGTYRLQGTVTFIDQPPERLWAAHLAAVQGRVTVDLRGLEWGDSVALALLLEWEGRARSVGDELQVTHVPDRLQDLMRVYGLAQVFGIT